jgi:hypothetical protein
MTVLILLVIYYIVIGILYYRNDAVRLFKEGFGKRNIIEPAPLSVTSADQKTDPVLFSSVHELMVELKDVFFTAAGKYFPEEELVMALQSTLKRYQHLKNTQFEAAINSHIQQSASSICNIILDHSTIGRIW